MLTEYENKDLFPEVKDLCPSCGEKDWKTILRGQKQVQRYKVCKKCGHVKKVKR